MERLSYSEAREWFWLRTAVWFVPASMVSVIAHFEYARSFFDLIGQRTAWSVGVGVGSVAVAVLAAYLTQQTPWMRMGLRLSYVLNGPACAAISALIALILCGIILTFLQASPPNAVESKAAYQAYLDGIDSTYRSLVFGCGACVFWGFVFGSWFAMRRDKYFVDPIMG